MTAANEQIAATDPAQVRQVERARDRGTFAPPVDILETADEVVLRADLPGVSEKDVDISLEKGVLTLRAKGAETLETEGMRELQQEYVSGDYERAFSLSDEIDQENIRASVKNGVLTLRLPKAGPARARKIDIVSE